MACAVEYRSASGGCEPPDSWRSRIRGLTPPARLDKGASRMALDRFDLSGRTALVTGGSKGLGKAMARGFAAAGADVFISSRNEDELKSALKEITAGTKVRGGYCVADLSKRSESARLGKAAIEALGKVDI